MKQIKLLALIGVGLILSSCNDKNDDMPNVIEPSTYSFERNGQSTISFDGQSHRLLMVEEIFAKFKDFDALDETQVLNMYNHREGANDFKNVDLNATDKNIRSKVAASAQYFATNSVEAEKVKKHFEDLIKDQATSVKSKKDEEATAGTAGQVTVGGKTRYVSAKGYENDQLFMKGMMGALVADQVLNNYLSKDVLDRGNNRSENDKGVTKSGKPYTNMEHNWDEAFGYIYGGKVLDIANPVKPHNNLLHKYIINVNKNENFKGIADEIFSAFKKGRAAIVAKNYDMRDQQANILREKISTVLAVRCIHYLESGKVEIAKGTRKEAFHSLSEALGFLYSLQFTQNPTTGKPYLSKTEVEDSLNKILKNNGLWEVEANVLGEVSKLVASKFNFSVEQAAK